MYMYVYYICRSDMLGLFSCLLCIWGLEVMWVLYICGCSGLNIDGLFGLFRVINVSGLFYLIDRIMCIGWCVIIVSNIEL